MTIIFRKFKSSKPRQIKKNQKMMAFALSLHAKTYDFFVDARSWKSLKLCARKFGGTQ